MSILLLLPAAGVAAPPTPPPASGVSPVWDPVVHRGPIQQTGIREELEVERRILNLDDEDIAILFSTLI